MRVNRAYIDAPLGPGLVVQLPEHSGGHLVRVLRLREGDECVLFNGDGHDYSARIRAIGKRGIEAEVVASTRLHNESPLAITLLQGIARGEKMDLILQKATELGVNAIMPVQSERSEVKLDGARAEKRLAHWRGVVAAACEQCGRARIPQVSPPMSLTDAAAIDGLPQSRHLLSPLADTGIDAVEPAMAALALAIGPEGGWSPRDLQSLADAGFSGLRLGPRILRTETAGLAAIAALQMRLGDLR